MSAARVFVHGLDPAGFGPALDPAVLEGLSLRALALAGPDDLAVVEQPPDAEFLDWLGAQGRGPGAIVVPRPAAGSLTQRLSADPQALARVTAHGGRVEPYASGPAERALAATLGLELHGSPDDLAERINHKAVLADWLARADLPAVPTLLVRRDELASAAAEHVGDGPLILRADLGIAGLGVWIVADRADLARLPAALRAYAPDDQFLLQALLPTRSSPNVQLDLDGSGVRLVGASEQRLTDGVHHTGNRFPLTDPARGEVLRQGQALADVLWQAGYRGYLGIDFIVADTGDVAAIEINPRLNTSSFGLLTLGQRVAAAGDGATLISLSRVPVPGAQSFAGFRARLGDGRLLESDGERGVFPVLPPLPGRPFADFVVLDTSADAAEQASADVLARLSTCEATA